MTETFLQTAEPNCSAEEFDGELVAINLETGIYFSIKASGAAIWGDLNAGHSIETIRALASARGDLAVTTDSFIQQLQDHGLMRRVDSAAVPSKAPSFAAFTDAVDLPELESFGDMQSLLLLDPVHEVDAEVGWPLAKKD
ncbi:PqqD family protein [Devosia sp. MC532]|uniref:PqqD family protein n=1 Tax=Devosia sp. MC532 TaxID=2799788 RepID=UPI0018F3D17F|nr:PqqD family protein [Devosia sp. MC532]MBJ7577454.1 PqqD family protein [Devosia sp. MC532]